MASVSILLNIIFNNNYIIINNIACEMFLLSGFTFSDSKNIADNKDNL